MSEGQRVHRILKRDTLARAGCSSGGRSWLVPRLNVRGAPEPPAAPAASPAPSQPAAPSPSAQQSAALERALASAEARLASVEAECERKVAGAQRELESERASHAADLAKQRSVTRRAVAALRVAQADLRAAQAEACLAVEGRAVELALEIARRIVGEAARRGEHDMYTLVSTLLLEARRRFPSQPVRLILNPSDADALSDLDLGPGVELVVEAAVPSGEARIDAEDGQVWDGLFTRLDALASALLGKPEGQEGSRAA